MKDSEIEVKFFLKDKKDFQKKLKDCGAQKIHDEFLMKRLIYEKKDNHQCDWFRIRQEYEKTTLTFKSKQDNTFGGMKEFEVVVSDFEKTRKIFDETGLTKLAYQENYRETWVYKNTEIVLDTWPFLPFYIEIEGNTKKEVVLVSKELGFDIEKEGIYGTVIDLYKKKYNITSEEFHSIKNFVFNTDKPLVLKDL